MQLHSSLCRMLPLPLLPTHLQPWKNSGENEEGKSLTVMLAIAHTMASHTGLASPLFSVNEHGGRLAMAARLSRRRLGNKSADGGVLRGSGQKSKSSGLSSSTSSCVVRLRRNATQRSATQPLGCSVAESQCRRGRLAAVGAAGPTGKKQNARSASPAGATGARDKEGRRLHRL